MGGGWVAYSRLFCARWMLVPEDGMVYAYLLAHGCSSRFSLLVVVVVAIRTYPRARKEGAPVTALTALCDGWWTGNFAMLSPNSHFSIPRLSRLSQNGSNARCHVAQERPSPSPSINPLLQSPIPDPSPHGKTPHPPSPDIHPSANVAGVR